MSSGSLCGDSIGSRRGQLALLWFILTILTGIAFLTAFIFAITTNATDEDESYNYYDYHDRNSQDEQGNRNDPEVAVTSRALAFSALWTGVLAALMAIFGTVILGWQSPTGQYYTCCSSSVHRTTPLGLGSFIGALLMLSNLTLICSVLFGEFEVRNILGLVISFGWRVWLPGPILWLSSLMLVATAFFQSFSPIIHVTACRWWFDSRLLYCINNETMMTTATYNCRFEIAEKGKNELVAPMDIIPSMDNGRVDHRWPFQFCAWSWLSCMLDSQHSRLPTPTVS